MIIEELAFKDRKNLAQLNEKDLLDIIEFLQDDRKQWINQFSKTHNESIEIQEENQKLKEKYLNAVADYEITMVEKNKLKSQLKGTTHCYDEEEHKRLSEQLKLLTSKLDEYDLIVDERNQLKKQLEEKIKIGVADHKYSSQCEDKVITMETQQKEFIKYLEDKIYSIEPKGTGINFNCEYDSEEDYVMAMQEQSRLNTLKEILQKYKEIIGENKDEKDINYCSEKNM